MRREKFSQQRKKWAIHVKNVRICEQIVAKMCGSKLEWHCSKIDFPGKIGTVSDISLVGSVMQIKAHEILHIHCIHIICISYNHHSTVLMQIKRETRQNKTNTLIHGLAAMLVSIQGHFYIFATPFTLPFWRSSLTL